MEESNYLVLKKYSHYHSDYFFLRAVKRKDKNLYKEMADCYFSDMKNARIYLSEGEVSADGSLIFNYGVYVGILIKVDE